MSDEDMIQVGCMKCKRARATKIQKTLDMLMEPAFDELKKVAAKEGIVIPDEFHQKMIKWSRKNGLLAPEVLEPTVAAVTFPQNLD
jgi:hypothetical protein